MYEAQQEVRLQHARLYQPAFLQPHFVNWSVGHLSDLSVTHQERVVRRTYFVILALALIAACSSTHQAKTYIAVEVEFGYWTSYSSSSGVLSQENCLARGDQFKVSVNLSAQTLETIASNATRSGFFSAKSPPPNPRPGPEAVQINSPCATSTLGIKYGGKQNSISWSCNTHGGGDPPKEAKAAYLALIAVLQPHLSKLPEHQCRLR